MRRRMVFWIMGVAGLVLLSWSTPSQAEPALSLHVGPTSYPACTAIDPDRFSCADIVVEGDASSTQRVYVLMSGVDAFRAVEFGISYPAGVDVLYWQACDEAMAIPETNWPASDTGLALSWGEGVVAGGLDKITIVGYFEVDAGSSGLMSLTVDPRSGHAAYVDTQHSTHAIPAVELGRADVDGGGGGLSTCGSGAGWNGPMSWGGSESMAMEEVEVEYPLVYTPSQSTNTLDCGSFGIAHESEVWTTDTGLGGPTTDDTPHTLRTISDEAGNDEPVMYALNWDTVQYESTPGVVRTRTNGSLRYAQTFSDPSDPTVPREAYLPRRHFMEVDGPNGTIYYVAEDATPSGTRITVSAVSSTDPDINQWRYTYHNTIVDGDDFLGGIGLRNGTLFVGGYAENGPVRRPFAFTLDAATGALEETFTYPFPNHHVDIRDVALDPRPGGAFWMMGAAGTSLPHGVARLALDPTDLELATGSAIFSTSDASFLPEMMEVSDGGAVAIAGVVSNPTHTGDYDLFVLGLTAPNAASVYTRYDDQWADVQVADLLVGTTGDVYLLGGVFPTPPPPLTMELAIVRVNPEGTIQWDSRVTCLADEDQLGGGAVAVRDLSVLVGVGMFAPNSGTICEDRSCVNLLGVRRDTGMLFYHGLDAEPSGGREPVVLRTGHQVNGAFRVYSGAVYPRWGIGLDGLTLSAFEVTPPDVVAIADPEEIAGDAPAVLLAREVAGALRVQLANGSSRDAVDVGVYDVTGREVERIRLEVGQRTGRTRPLASGVYFLRAYRHGVDATARAVVTR